jgi:diguanylate cyclase (GGDEF)-like protein/PAS domain S-box-containing protein
MSEIHDPEIFRSVLDSLRTGVYVSDPNGKILFWNQGAEQITGYMRHDVVGRTCRNNILLHCDQKNCVACGAKCPFAQTMHDGTPLDARMQFRHKEGYPVSVLMRVAPVRDPHGAILALAESFEMQRNVDNGNRDPDAAVPHGFLDEITGLPNSVFTMARLRENLGTFSDDHLPLAVICIQVEQLEHFRSSYGREASDAILRVVGQTLRNGFRPSDFLGRWTEDHFVAILVNCGSVGAEKAGERIQQVVRCAGIHWWGEELSITTSVGCTTAQVGDTVEAMMLRAQPEPDSAAPVSAKHVTVKASGEVAQEGLDNSEI